jgi:hypothetical protein
MLAEFSPTITPFASVSLKFQPLLTKNCRAVASVYMFCTLELLGGADTFKYHFKTAGNDTILDFDTNSDKIDLSILLDGYNTSSTLSNFIASTGNGSNTIISVDANGGEAFETDISITLIGVTGVNLTSLISSGNLVLE